jgi:hypothetical protein
MTLKWTTPVSIGLLACAMGAAPPPAPPTTPATGAAGSPDLSPLKPTLITIHHTDAPAAEVFKDLFGQIGRGYITYPDAPEKWPTVTLNAVNEPYWEVVARLDDALGAYAYPRRNGIIAINHGGPSPESGLRCFSGPCLMVARVISHTAYLTNPDHLDDCTINTMLLIEPTLQVAMYSGRVIPDVAVDERGVSLLPAPAAPHPVVRTLGIEPDLKPVQLDVYNEFQIVLRVPSNAGHKVARVKGNVHLKLMEKATVIDIPAAEFALPRTIDFLGARVAISAVKESGAGINRSFRVSLDMTHAGISDEQWARVFTLLDAATISIVDADGFPFFTAGSGGGGSVESVNRIISGTFRPTEGNNVPGYQAGEPAFCRITLPEVIRDVAIPFEYKDLPLP